MKKLSGVMFVLLIAAILPLNTGAGVLGDINGDGHVDITEALFALQIASGNHPNLPDSCVITGFGDWQTGQSYNVCDVVFLDGSFYICTQSHLSSASNNPPNDTYWANLALKGDTGPPGPSGSSGGQGPQGPPGVCHHVPLDTVSTYPAVSQLPCRVTIDASGGQFFGSVNMEALLHITAGIDNPQQFEITRNWPMQGSVDVRQAQSNQGFSEVVIETYVSGVSGDPSLAIVHGRWIISNAFPNNIKYRYAIDPASQITYVTETITLTSTNVVKENTSPDETIDISNITTPPVETYIVTIDVDEADSLTICEPIRQEIYRRSLSFFDLHYNVPLNMHGGPGGELQITWMMRKRLYTFRDEPEFNSPCIDTSYMEWTTAGTGSRMAIKGWGDQEASVNVFEITNQIPMVPVSYDVYQVEGGLYETFTVEPPVQP